MNENRKSQNVNNYFKAKVSNQARNRLQPYTVTIGNCSNMFVIVSSGERGESFREEFAAAWKERGSVVLCKLRSK